MNSDNIQSWIGLAANVGVLIGVVFVVLELEQNSTDTRMEAQISLSERYSEQDGSIAENPQLAELIVRAEQHNETLTDAEARQYQGHYDRWMNILMIAEQMYDAGVLTDIDWLGYVCEVRRKFLRYGYFRTFVETAKARYLSQRIYDSITREEFCGA